jgi:hypothetical protein
LLQVFSVGWLGEKGVWRNLDALFVMKFLQFYPRTLLEKTMQIISRSDAKEQGLKYFFNGKSCRRGHLVPRTVSAGACTQCESENKKSYRKSNAEAVSEYKRRYRENNRNSISQYNSLYRDRNPSYSIKYREANPEYSKKYREKNGEKLALYGRSYRGENRDRIRALLMKRRAAELAALMPDRTREDVSREIEIAQRAKAISRKTGVLHHCDHIIALQGVLAGGAKIWGPHVWWNLRPLTASENIAKGNRVKDGDIAEALGNLRASGATESYIQSIEENLRLGRHPNEWVIP